MKFGNLHIDNFLSFTSTVLCLDKLGLVCLLGENQDAPLNDNNGSGKSAVLEAIVWCLWGKTIRGLKDDEVVNLTVGKNCKVSLDIEDEGVTYTIVRSRLMEGKKPNDLVLLVDGKNASQRKLATQDKINQILGMDSIPSAP